MTETFPTPGPVVLEVRIPDGTVEIEAAATQETVVDLTGLPDSDLAEIARVEMRERGGTYEVRVEVDDDRRGFARLWKGRELRLEIRVPEAAEVRARTRSADVRGRGVFGTVAVDTASGDVEFGEVTGDAAVKAASGDIRLREVSGDAVVSTASGDIDIERVVSSAHLRSASGDVHVGEAGADVTVQTASGDQQIDEVSNGQVTLQSASGDLNVRVRRGSRLAVDARSMSGDTHSEIELDEVSADEPTEDGRLVELRATAMSGDIHVGRA